MKSTVIKRLCNIFLLLIFIVIIFTPLYQARFNLLPELQSSEKRKLASKPELNLSTLKIFPEKYNKFFNDTFPFRNNLIQLHNLVKVKYFHVSPIASYVIGKDEWFFYTGSYNDLWGGAPYTTEQLETIVRIRNAHNAIFKENDIYFILITIPDKQTIYPEYIPLIAGKRTHESRLAQEIAYFRKHSDVNFIDLREPLKKAKQIHPVYYKSDTHWDAYGSFIAYQEIAKNLSQHFDITPLSLSDFNITVKKTKANGDITKGLYMENEFSDVEINFGPKEKFDDNKIENEKLSKVIIYHDSFMDPKYKWSSTKLFKYHFDKVITITNNKTFDLEYIRKEKPDVVIYEVVERSI